MVSNHLIILVYDMPWEWSTDFQNQTAKVLSKQNVVLCLSLSPPLAITEYLAKFSFPKLVQKKSENLYVFTQVLFIPFTKRQFVLRINNFLNRLFFVVLIKFLRKINKINKTIFWSFKPWFYRFHDLAGMESITIYDCVDYYYGSLTSYQTKIRIPNSDTRFIKKFDIVVVNSQTLRSVHLGIRPDVAVVPQGFRLETFSKNSDDLKIKLPTNNPTVGYIGGINSRLDYKLILELAKRNKNYNFIFVGQIQDNEKDYFYNKVKPQIDSMFKQDNVFYFPPQPKEDLPALIRRFDVCMIPYNSKMSFNRYCFPMKFFEYFYCGKPVISTYIEELNYYNKLVKIGNSVSEWENYLRELLTKPWPQKYQNEERLIAKKHSWENKIEEISKLIDSYYKKYIPKVAI